VRPAVALIAALAICGGARAAVYASQERALAEAFPGAERIEARSVLLDDAQAAALEARAQVKLERRIWTIHEAHAPGGALLGTAVIDIHTVRTLPEALLVVLTPEGALRSVRMLAFHEPSEYQPPSRWLAQFEGRVLSPELHLHRGVHALAGATLSSQAILRSVRTVLALHEILAAATPTPAP
jgi:hypothetical protein